MRANVEKARPVLYEDIPQNSDTVRQKALEALRRKIIPWLSTGQALPVVLAEPPVIAPPGVKILGYRPPLPEIPRLKPPSLHECIWSKQFMAAPRYIGIGCVLEGEADFALGTNIDVPVGGAAGFHQPGIELLTFPAGTLFVLPPGVPRTSGEKPHWERPAPETAYSRVFWLLLLPSVLFCHICRTRGTTHDSDGVITVEDHYLEPIAQAILDELRMRAGRFDQVVGNLMLGLLQRVERDLSSEAIFPGRQTTLVMHSLPRASLLVQSVCQFMHQHRNEPLTLSGLASRHLISPSQLNRRFRTEIGMSVIEYLIHCRIEAAKHLLLDLNETRLSIQQISSLAGFSDTSYFGRLFKKQVGMAPAKFREFHRRQLHRLPEEDSAR